MPFFNAVIQEQTNSHEYGMWVKYVLLMEIDGLVYLKYWSSMDMIKYLFNFPMIGLW